MKEEIKMLNFLAAMVATVMLWGTTTNPVVKSTHYTVSDPFTGEVKTEWITNYHLNGEEETIRIEP